MRPRVLAARGGLSHIHIGMMFRRSAQYHAFARAVVWNHWKQLGFSNTKSLGGIALHRYTNLILIILIILNLSLSLSGVH